MKIFKNFLGLTALALIFTAAASADTLELKDGRVLQGKFLGGTRVIVRFEVEGDVQTFRVNEISALSFDRHSRHDDRRDDRARPTTPRRPMVQPTLLRLQINRSRQMTLSPEQHPATTITPRPPINPTPTTIHLPARPPATIVSRHPIVTPIIATATIVTETATPTETVTVPATTVKPLNGPTPLPAPPSPSRPANPCSSA